MCIAWRLSKEMEKTREKLEEARFFLSHLELNYQELPIFRHYLNAFISSARSVLWIMRAEYCRVSGWEDWFKSQQPTPEEQELMTQTTEARNRTEKQSPLKPVYQLEAIVDAEQLSKSVEELKSEMIGKEFRLDIRGLSDDMTQEVLIIGEENEFIGEVERYFVKLDEFKNEDVLDVCRAYLLFLERAVDECERTFG
jgi:hypothetical protein